MDENNQQYAKSNPESESTPPATPTAWPGAFGTYKHSKQAVQVNLGPIVILWILAVLIGGGLQFVLDEPGQFFNYVINIYISAAAALLYIAGARGHKMTVGESLKHIWPLLIPLFLLNLLVTLTYIVSIVLLIIPFFFIAPRLALATYFMVDKNLGVVDSYKASWNAMQGHLLKIYGIVGANILMALLAVTIIGIPFAVYFLIMYQAATAILYELTQKPTGSNDPQTTPNPILP